ncbi:Ger(x)C family spore germination protein [Paenibacillus sp. MBLB4367]|uniref:Ger(x)C family spore germination protein n=1 Tax=Paenibacillus sp. MBLB4367 TaxID=3384767 RepID=UPI00390822C6
MKRLSAWFVAAMIVLLIPGSPDRLILEDISLGLVFGIDVDESNELVFYFSSPVFGKEARKKNEEYEATGSSLRQVRMKFDSLNHTLVVGGKYQVCLLGKRVLEHEDWFTLFDVLYRDAKFAVNTRIVAVDGPVEDIVYTFRKDKPPVPLHLSKLIDTADRRNLTTKTTLQQLHRQMYERGITPFFTFLGKRQQIEVKGTALLNQKGKFMTEVNPEENKLLRIMQRINHKEMTLTMDIPGQGKEKGVPIQTDKLTIVTDKVRTKIRCGYEGGKFRFAVDVQLSGGLSERLFPFDVLKRGEELERMIAEQLEKQFTSILGKLKKAEIDPVGFGLYARAYQYEAWKGVQNEWGKAFAQSDTDVAVHVRIRSMGSIR